MEFKKMSKDELELLSYTDITELILKENNSPLNTPTIFKQICDILEYGEEEYTSKIGDFYTSLTTDKRFTFLETGEWDLAIKHPVKIELDDDEEEIDEEEIDEEEIEEEQEEMIDDDIIDDELDTDDDLEDLAIISDEELEEN